MDIRELREVLRKEKASPYPQSIGTSFYSDARKMLREMQEECRKTEDLELLSLKLKELENLRNLIKAIYETRENKIVNLALYTVRGGELELENLTGEEQEVLNRLVEVLREGRERVLRKEEREERDGVEFMTVRILRDLPQIVGADGRIYGEFRAEDVVTLPEPNARILVERGDAERVSVKELEGR